MMVNGKQL